MSSSEQPASSDSAKDNTSTADADGSEETITFTVKAINDTKITTTINPYISVAELKQKLAPEADIPADRQRLIYSGRVLKDDQTVNSYKIQNGNTVHLVRAAASNTTAATGQPSTGAATTSGTAGRAASSTPTLPSMAAGTGSNPIARFANHVQLPSAEMFGPDGGMGPPPNPDEMLRMMEQPGFRATMNQLLQNPTMLDHLIQSNPMLQQLGPEARQMMQTEEFRQMMTDPQLLRQMTQMQQALGLNPFGGGRMGAGGRGGSFPAPGVTDQTPAAAGAASTGESGTAGSTEVSSTSPPPNPFAGNPFAALFNPGGAAGAGGAAAGAGGGTPGSGGNAANPFGGLFGNPAILQAAAAAAARNAAAASGQNQSSEAGAGNPSLNPFTPPNLDINQLQQMMQLFGGGGLGGLGGLGGGAPAAPPDTRPIEERYAEQLRQLNDMGFFDFDRNCEALRRSGGSVQGAVEYLLSQP